MNNKREKLLTIIGVMALLLFGVGATFAYFVAQGGNAEQTGVNVLTHTTDSLVFEVGKAISITADQTTFAPGAGNRSDDTFARATLKANSSTNSATANYYVYLAIDTNEFKYTTDTKTAELILTVNYKDTNENITPLTNINGLNYVTVGSVSGFDITEEQNLITIANNYEITSTGTEIDEWDITLTLVNLDSNQTANAGKTFNATLLIQKEMVASQYIASLFTTQGSNNLYHHNGTFLATEANDLNGVQAGDVIDANDGSYRYAGAYETTNNWVCFGTDDTTAAYANGWCDDEHLYRIIGVFGGKLKLIKAYEGTEASLETNSDGKGSKNPTYYKGKLDPTPGYKWDSNRINDWSLSTLNSTVLNETYLNKLMSDKNNWKDKIETTKWKIGGNTWESIGLQTAIKAYQNEIVSSVQATTYNSKVGLMYVSDYGFAASPENWTTTLNSYNNDTNRNNNWLFIGIYEWTISPTIDINNQVYVVHRDGGVYRNSANVANGVRPTFYLKSSVTFAGGTGTETDPYRIK